MRHLRGEPRRRSEPVPRGATRTGRLLRRFLRERRGVTAVEFGLVATPFFAIIGAIIETALSFWCGQILDNALGDAARQIYTGQFQQGTTGLNTSQLLQALQDRLCKVNGDANGAARTTIFACSAVKLDVQVYGNFGSSTIRQPVDSATGNWSSGYGTRYASAQPSDIVIVQAAVAFPIFFTLWNPNQASFGTGPDKGKRLLQSTVAFRTEPYQ